MAAQQEPGPPGRSGHLWNDPRARSIFYQIVLATAIIAFIYYIVDNTARNLEERGIASGFSFLGTPAGFDVAMSPFFKYDLETATYFDVLLVGMSNTLLAALIGCPLATILGFIVGVLRLSSNWMVSRIAYVYVETMRNIPLLLHLLFWYFLMVGVLPQIRDAISVGDAVYLSNRGLFAPMPVPEDGFWVVGVAFAVAIALVIYVAKWAKRRQNETGKQFPTILVSIAILFGLPFIVLALAGFPIYWDFPQRTRFNMTGGIVLLPEFAALLFGLVAYTGAFIAEIVRAGIQAISHGQTEAAYSLGVKPNVTMRLIIIPQALRVIIPPLTSQYLNLTKNSSLGVAIGATEIVSVWMGTTLNQAGQAVEIIAITMAFYMTVSLITSAFMNWYNQRIALTER
jgi:general L-amino acid transport system permease protein